MVGVMTNRMTDEQLIARITDTAILRGNFTLRSGRTSTYYIDKYLFETQPDIVAELGRRFAERLSPEVNRVAGAELGGIPLVTATAMACAKPMVLIRNQKKDYGTAKQIEGMLNEGDVITIVEDVVTSGGQSLEAARTLEAMGAKVTGIIAVIDRQEGGAEHIREAGFEFDALLTRTDLGIEG